MVTFLRQVRKSLLESGAARRYFIYAAGEIVLVVVGILIALQINNWNESRNEREQECNVLHELIENLEINVKRLDVNIERGNTDNSMADVLITSINKNNPYSDTLDRYFPLALNPVDEGSFISFVGYESLKNTGFDIIQNYELKKEIITLFEGTYKDLRARYDRIQLSNTALNGFIDQHFYMKASESREYAPIDYQTIVKNNRLMSWMMKLKGHRHWIAVVLLTSRTETQSALQNIQEELEIMEK